MLGGGDEGRRVGGGGRAWQAGPGTVVEAQGQRMTWGHTSVQHRAAAALPTMPRASPCPRPVPPGGARASESLLGLCPEEPPASLVQTPPRAHHQALAQGLAPCPNPSLAGLPVSALLSTSHSPPKDERGLRGGSPGSPRPRAGSPPGAHRPQAHRAPGFHGGSLPRSLERPLLFPAPGPPHLLSPLPGVPALGLLPARPPHLTFGVSSA